MILLNLLNRFKTILGSTVLLLMVPTFISGQLFDDFSDGDFSQNPSWSGTTENFTINSEKLQLNDTPPLLNQSYLTTPNPLPNLDNKEWRIWIKQNFSGSDNNNSRIYITSNGGVLSFSGNNSAGVEGYFLRLGEAGSGDVIRFYKDNGTSISLLASGTTSIAASFTVNIKITRDDSGNWTLSADYSGGEDFTDELFFMDDSYNSSSFFGVVCTYTASNASNFFFDDIYAGEIIVDTIPPHIISVNAVSANTIDVLFDENLDLITSQYPFNYALSPSENNTISPLRDDENHALLHLLLSSPLEPNIPYFLTIQGVQDEYGNVMEAQEIEILFSLYGQASYRDIVFNEILADPTPSAGLPEVEFVELYNTHPTLTYPLEGLKFVNTNTEKTLPSFNLTPKGYVILCDASNVLLFEPYGNVIGIPSFVALTNSTDSLTLKSPNGEIIDRVVYRDTWYNSAEKREGGWSLELVNPYYSCQGAFNWKESLHPNGGTPGAVNSVFDDSIDETPPKFKYTAMDGEQGVVCYFDKPLGNDFIENIQFVVNGVQQTNDDFYISGVERNELVLPFGTMQPNITYHFTLDGVADCNGNLASPVRGRFCLPEIQEKGDIIINEVLSNPYDGGNDFVEIYNRSSKVISLKNWQIADATNGIMNTPKLITDKDFLLFPNEYLVLTRKPESVFSLYPGAIERRLWSVPNFPDFSSSDEVFLLYGSEPISSDRFIYDSEMHYPLLNSTKGISLERISAQRSSLDKTNWHSAAASAGYATPGYLNSQSGESFLASHEFEVLPEIFSPDNDGYNDVVVFSYRLEKEGFLGNIKIFNSAGQLVRHLMKSELLGTSGSISWDGFSEDRQKAAMGIYVVFFEAFSLDGDTVRNKKSCVIAHSLR